MALGDPNQAEAGEGSCEPPTPRPAPGLVPLWWNWQTQPPCTRSAFPVIRVRAPAGARLRIGASTILAGREMPKDEEQKKPGPDAQRLVIEEDPEEALRKLLRRPETEKDKEPGENRRG